MALHSESNLNYALATILKTMARNSELHPESTRVMLESAGEKPDVFITAKGRAHVIIEAEYEPARNVEAEALQRLGKRTREDKRPVEAVVALRYPAYLKSADDLNAALQNAKLEYAFFQESRRDSDQKDALQPERFPESGWLRGSPEDIADLIQMISVPQKAVAQAAEDLDHSIETAALILDEHAKTNPGISVEIAKQLGVPNVNQMRRMACAMIANALAFHERIAGMHNEVQPLSNVFRQSRRSLQDGVLDAWEQILDEIDYYPIFSIAQKILALMPSNLAQAVLDKLRSAAEGALVTNAHELTGRVFQRLISDRKYLAAFYTLPESAALLARLAVSKLLDIDWSSRESIERLRIVDFACGTGALLSAVYEQIAALHEREGGNPDELHPAMLEKSLHGCDVMASAAHITAASLASANPGLALYDSQIYTMPFGRQSDNTVRIGSLELLTRSNVKALFRTSDPAKSAGGKGEIAAEREDVNIPNESCDLVIMNPPFTRNTAKEGKYLGTFAGAFAAFEASIKDQKDMAERMKTLKAGTCYHGHAGMASGFAALADRKLKPDGVIALVMPLTAVSAPSWTKMRTVLAQNYTDIDVLSIAAAEIDQVSFSADTNLAEVLIVARKNGAKSRHVTSRHVTSRHVTSRHVGRTTAPTARFTSLLRRPATLVHSFEIEKQLQNSASQRHINDGPYSGSLIYFGEETAGGELNADISLDGAGWGGVRIVDYSVAQAAYALTQSKLWAPGVSEPINLNTVLLEQIAKLGYHSLDLTGDRPQGPFDKLPPSPTSTYPCLWNHNAKNEKKIVCEPDSQLQPRRGLEQKAAGRWATASRCHHNQDFRFGSQPLAVAFTLRKTIGGRAWPNIIFNDDRFDYAFALWGNSSLGLLMHWWHGSRQQPGGSIMARTAAATLPILDLRTLSDAQLQTAKDIFDELRGTEFKAAYLADRDKSRELLDELLFCELLGFDKDIFRAVRKLSAKWAAEPSVRGSKKRPAGPLAV